MDIETAQGWTRGFAKLVVPKRFRSNLISAYINKWLECFHDDHVTLARFIIKGEDRLRQRLPYYVSSVEEKSPKGYFKTQYNALHIQDVQLIANRTDSDWRCYAVLLRHAGMTAREIGMLSKYDGRDVIRAYAATYDFEMTLTMVQNDIDAELVKGIYR